MTWRIDRITRAPIFFQPRCADTGRVKAHVDALDEIEQLKQAIDANDLTRVKNLMTRNRELHHAPLGYGKNGRLTWVAECRVPWEPPSPPRLAIAKWMIENGSDVHQGGDGPLMRAALKGNRIPMMELLVSCGADVNAEWNGDFPIIFAPCEALDPKALKWLLCCTWPQSSAMLTPQSCSSIAAPTSTRTPLWTIRA